MLDRPRIGAVLCLCLGLCACVGLFAAASATANAPKAAKSAESNVDWPSRLDEARPRAVGQIVISSGSEHVFLRANSMEACEHLDPDRALPLLHLGMDDDQVPVQFAALATVGKLKRMDMVASVRRYEGAQSPYVRAAALFALQQCDQDVDLSPLAGMLRSTDPALRGSVATLIGMMGDTSAVEMLKQMAQVPLPATTTPVSGVIARIQVAEAMIRLGDDSVLSIVRWGLYSAQPEVCVLAATMLGRIGDHTMEEAFFVTLQDDHNPVELRLAALEALTRMGGSIDMVGVALESEPMVLGAGRSDQSLIRAQAAHTLGTMESARRRALAYLNTLPDPPPHRSALAQRLGTARVLLALLDDRVEQVRLSAAVAILGVRPTQGANVVAGP